MIIQALVLSIAIGLFRRGNLRNLGQIPLRHVSLFILSFVILGIVIIVAMANMGPVWQPYLRVLNVLQYMALLAAIAVNLHVHMMWLVGIGTFLNFVVIAANGGMMPVSATALQLAGMPEILQPERVEQFVRHVMISPETRLKWLADVIPVPGFSFIDPQVASIGDVLISVAVLVLVQQYMCTSKSATRTE